MIFDAREALRRAAGEHEVDRDELTAETIAALQRRVSELREKQQREFDEETEATIFMIGLMLRQLRN